MNFHDFAGSTVVHSIGGGVALAGAIVLGPRLGRKFKRDGGGPMTPHDLTIAVCGGLLLWFGWYGFHPGSTLAAMDFEGVGRVAANTTLAACAARSRPPTSPPASMSMAAMASASCWMRTAPRSGSRMWAGAAG